MGLFDRFRRDDRTPPPAPTDSEIDGAAELADWLRGFASAGLRDFDEVVEAAAEAVDDDPESFPGLDEDDARRVAATVWADLVAREESWPDEGDYPRLIAASDDLAERGVLARMDFTCCQNCGHTEIGDERDGEDDPTWAYTFFHQQDTERLEPGGADLYLAFGTFRASRDVDASLLERAAGDEDAQREVMAHSDVLAARRWSTPCAVRA